MAMQMGGAGVGLLDNTDALLALSSGLLSARGNFGQGLGAGLSNMQQALAAQRAEAAAQQMRDAQLQLNTQQLGMGQMQMQEAQRAADERKQIAAFAARRALNPVQVAMEGNGGPTNAAAQAAAAPGAQGRFDYQGFANDMASLDPFKAVALQTALKKEGAKVKDIQVMTDPRTKQPVNVITYEDGTQKVSPYGAKPDIKLQGLGNRVAAIDVNQAQNGNVWQMGASPDAVLGANTQTNIATQTDKRTRELDGNVQYVQDGNSGLWQALPKKVLGPQSSITPIPVKGETKQVTASKEALPMIDEAAKILKGDGTFFGGPTSSWAGAARDLAGNVVGYGTDGSIEGARLKVIAGKLQMAQPRMEGPQSNADGALYASMAGNVGDSTLPVSTRLSALAEMRNIADRWNPDGTPKAGMWNPNGTPRNGSGAAPGGLPSMTGGMPADPNAMSLDDITNLYRSRPGGR